MLGQVPNLVLTTEQQQAMSEITRNPAATEKLGLFFRLIAEEKQAKLVQASAETIPVLQGEARLAIQLANAFSVK